MTPRIASERLDSGETRISKIMAMIRESRFGIHDLSRLKSSGEGAFFRLNMPFELGLDIGCRAYGSGNLTSKRCLILETDPYRYQAAISDLSNSDIEPHGDDPARAMTAVRNWLAAETERRIPGPYALWVRFGGHVADVDAALRADGHSAQDVATLPVPEIIRRMRDWVAANPR
jgi:hypothetical protein